jgi:hypothetical protein
MKYLLLLFILFISHLSFSQVTTFVPDDNFEAYLEANGMGNGVDNDNYVFKYLIEGLASLDVSSLNISELTGIEDFAELQVLHCEDNNLSNLDISQNTDLYTLYCHTNNLSEINISNNTLLKFFYCNSNEISELILTNNTTLLTLECSDNDLTTLDISTAIDLNYLDCGGNQITSLDLTDNYYLQYIYCYNNALTTMDLRNFNNMNINGFSSLNNPELTCIFVDEVSWCETNLDNIDTTTSFVADEAACDALIAVEEFSLAKSFKISPNPATTYFSIKTNVNIINIKVFNILGELVTTYQKPQKTYAINHLKRGLYLIQIKTEQGNFTKKLQVN